MTAPQPIQTAASIKASLAKARDIALNNVATLASGWTRDLNATLAEIANQMMHADAPTTALEDALTLCRNLMRDQAIVGQLEGVYPTERYGA